MTGKNEAMATEWTKISVDRFRNIQYLMAYKLRSFVRGGELSF
jgi:hypothetical protein